MSTYNYLSGGKLTINNVDDFKEFNLLVEAFKNHGFTTNEMNFYLPSVGDNFTFR